MDKPNLRRAARFIGASLVIVAIAWGTRVTVLEGFVEAWSRRFTGDFAAAMFTRKFWDGTGVAYGPLFVAERWLVNAWPGVLNIFTFALLDIAVVAGAFALCVRACRLGWASGAVALASWLCYWRLAYAFSVAANPELLELLFLSGAWWAASRARPRREGVLIAAAGITKLIPWVFVVQLLVRRRIRAIVSAACVLALAAIVVGIGQRMSVWNTVTQVLVPLGGHRASFLPIAGSTEFIGIPEVLTWILYADRAVAMTPLQARVIQLLFAGTALVTIMVTMAASLVVLRRRAAGEALAVIYAMFFALMPLVTPQVHVHTFVFLLPVWIGAGHALSLQWMRSRRISVIWWSAAIAACYVMTGFPSGLRLLDAVFGTTLSSSYTFYLPITGNVILMLVLWTYAFAPTIGVEPGVQQRGALIYQVH